MEPESQPNRTACVSLTSSFIALRLRARPGGDINRSLQACGCTQRDLRTAVLEKLCSLHFHHVPRSQPSGRTSLVTGRGNVSIDTSPREAIRPRCPMAFHSNRGLSQRISVQGGERCLSDSSFPSGESMKGLQVRGEVTRGVMTSSWACQTGAMRSSWPRREMDSSVALAVRRTKAMTPQTSSPGTPSDLYTQTTGVTPKHSQRVPDEDDALSSQLANMNRFHRVT